MRVELWVEPRSYDAPSPVIRGLEAAFTARGTRLTIRCPERELVRLDALPLAADLYLVKSDTELALSLAEALEAAGARVVNRTSAMRRAKDKPVAAAVLADARIPTPRSFVAARPSAFARRPWRPLVVKPARGYHGAGVVAAERADDLPADARYPDVVFAQERIRAQDEVKVVGVGGAIRALRKPFAPGSYATAGIPIPVTPELQDLGARARHAFALDLWGIDVVRDEHGMHVVDVNSFPGYRGVPDAAQLIAEWCLGAVRG